MPNSQDITAPFYPDVKLTEGHLKGIAKTRRGLIQMSHFDIKKLGDLHDSLLPLKCHSDLMCVGHKCLASLVWPHWYQKFNVFPPPYECLPWSQRDFPESAGTCSPEFIETPGPQEFTTVPMAKGCWRDLWILLLRVHVSTMEQIILV